MMDSFMVRGSGSPI